MKLIDTRPHNQLDLFIPLDQESDVHTSHCCGEHLACKYGDPDCPVANKLKLPDYPCNCDWF